MRNLTKKEEYEGKCWAGETDDIQDSGMSYTWSHMWITETLLEDCDPGDLAEDATEEVYDFTETLYLIPHW